MEQEHTTHKTGQEACHTAERMDYPPPSAEEEWVYMGHRDWPMRMALFHRAARHNRYRARLQASHHKEGVTRASPLAHWALSRLKRNRPE